MSFSTHPTWTVEPFATQITLNICYFPVLGQVGLPNVASCAGLCIELLACTPFKVGLLIDYSGPDWTKLGGIDTPTRSSREEWSLGSEQIFIHLPSSRRKDQLRRPRLLYGLLIIRNVGWNEGNWGKMGWHQIIPAGVWRIRSWRLEVEIHIESGGMALHWDAWSSGHLNRKLLR